MALMLNQDVERLREAVAEAAEEDAAASSAEAEARPAGEAA
jgi:hypothetical protein